MKVIAPIHDARERYVAFLRECVEKARGEHEEVAAEAMIRLSGPPDWTDLQRTLRIDLLWKEGDQPQATKVELEAVVPGPPVGAMQIEAMEVVVHPLAWHMCPVRFVHETPDFTAMNAWFRKWLGEEGASADEDGLRGVVHSLSPPMQERGSWVVLVDFGSAPVEALAELLFSLNAMGVTDVKLGTAPVWELKRSTLEAITAELDAPTFATTMAGVVQNELEAEVRVSGAMELEIQAAGASLRANLDNLYRVLGRLDAAGRANELGRWVESHREQFAKLTGEAPPPSIDDLRPMVKDQLFVDAVRKKIGEKTPTMWRRLAGDLWVVYVWDQPNGMQFLTNEDPGKHGLSGETLHARAVQNFLKRRPSVDMEAIDGIFVARTHDNYDASLLLDDGFWRQVGGRVHGDVLACVPTRDVVLISGTEEDGGLARIRTAAKKLMESGDHLVSATVLRRAGVKWEVFAGPVGKREDTGPQKKRPWWKLW